MRAYGDLFFPFVPVLNLLLFFLACYMYVFCLYPRFDFKRNKKNFILYQKKAKHVFIGIRTIHINMRDNGMFESKRKIIEDKLKLVSNKLFIFVQILLWAQQNPKVIIDIEQVNINVIKRKNLKLIHAIIRINNWEKD